MLSKAKILEIIQKSVPAFNLLCITSIGLFGSYAIGTASRYSDIDLLIDFDPARETIDNYMAANDLLEQLFNGFTIEVVTKNGLSKRIGPIIL